MRMTLVDSTDMAFFVRSYSVIGISQAPASYRLATTKYVLELASFRIESDATLYPLIVPHHGGYNS